MSEESRNAHTHSQASQHSHILGWNWIIPERSEKKERLQGHSLVVWPGQLRFHLPCFKFVPTLSSPKHSPPNQNISCIQRGLLYFFFFSVIELSTNTQSGHLRECWFKERLKMGPGSTRLHFLATSVAGPELRTKKKSKHSFVRPKQSLWNLCVEAHPHDLLESLSGTHTASTDSYFLSVFGSHKDRIGIVIIPGSCYTRHSLCLDCLLISQLIN